MHFTEKHTESKKCEFYGMEINQIIFENDFLVNQPEYL